MGNDPVELTEDGFERMQRAVRQENQLPPNRTVYRPHQKISTETGIRFYNNSGVVIPAFSIVAVTGSNGTKWATLPSVVKPSTTFVTTWLINGRSPALKGMNGFAQVGPVVTFAYDTGTPSQGDAYGPKNGQFTASKGYVGLLETIAVVDDTNQWATGFLKPLTQVLAQTTSSVSAGSGGATCNLWVGDAGSEVVSSGPMAISNVYNRTSVNIPAGKFVKLTLINGVWYMEPWEC